MVNEYASSSEYGGGPSPGYSGAGGGSPGSEYTTNPYDMASAAAASVTGYVVDGQRVNYQGSAEDFPAYAASVRAANAVNREQYNQSVQEQQAWEQSRQQAAQRTEQLPSQAQPIGYAALATVQNRPGYTPLGYVGDVTSQRVAGALYEATPAFNMLAMMGMPVPPTSTPSAAMLTTLEGQRQAAARAGDNRASQYYLNEETKMVQNTVELSSQYHHIAAATGIPTVANPFEYQGDLAVELLKGAPRRDVERFSPVSGEMARQLPSGQVGMQDVAWQQAKSGTPSDVSFGQAIAYFSSAENQYGPYGTLYGGPEYVGTPSSEGIRAQAWTPMTPESTEALTAFLVGQAGRMSDVPQLRAFTPMPDYGVGKSSIEITGATVAPAPVATPTGAAPSTYVHEPVYVKAPDLTMRLDTEVPWGNVSALSGKIMSNVTGGRLVGSKVMASVPRVIDTATGLPVPFKSTSRPQEKTQEKIFGIFEPAQESALQKYLESPEGSYRFSRGAGMMEGLIANIFNFIPGMDSGLAIKEAGKSTSTTTALPQTSSVVISGGNKTISDIGSWLAGAEKTVVEFTGIGKLETPTTEKIIEMGKNPFFAATNPPVSFALQVPVVQDYTASFIRGEAVQAQTKPIESVVNYGIAYLGGAGWKLGEAGIGLGRASIAEKVATSGGAWKVADVAAESVIKYGLPVMAAAYGASVAARTTDMGTDFSPASAERAGGIFIGEALPGGLGFGQGYNAPGTVVGLARSAAPAIESLKVTMAGEPGITSEIMKPSMLDVVRSKIPTTTSIYAKYIEMKTPETAMGKPMPSERFVKPDIRTPETPGYYRTSVSRGGMKEYEQNVASIEFYLGRLSSRPSSTPSPQDPYWKVMGPQPEEAGGISVTGLGGENQITGWSIEQSPFTPVKETSVFKTTKASEIVAKYEMAREKTTPPIYGDVTTQPKGTAALALKTEQVSSQLPVSAVYTDLSPQRLAMYRYRGRAQDVEYAYEGRQPLPPGMEYPSARSGRTGQDLIVNVIPASDLRYGVSQITEQGQRARSDILSKTRTGLLNVPAVTLGSIPMVSNQFKPESGTKPFSDVIQIQPLDTTEDQKLGLFDVVGQRQSQIPVQTTIPKTAITTIPKITTTTEPRPRTTTEPRPLQRYQLPKEYELPKLVPGVGFPGSSGGGSGGGRRSFGRRFIESFAQPGRTGARMPSFSMPGLPSAKKSAPKRKKK